MVTRKKFLFFRIKLGKMAVKLNDLSLVYCEFVVFMPVLPDFAGDAVGPPPEQAAMDKIYDYRPAEYRRL
jgi:hypothetical protein